MLSFAAVYLGHILRPAHLNTIKACGYGIRYCACAVLHDPWQLCCFPVITFMHYFWTTSYSLLTSTPSKPAAIAFAAARA